MREFRLLTRDAVLPLSNLRVHPEQESFVAPNAVTMAQAAFEPGVEAYGIWDGDVPVGMIAIVDMAILNRNSMRVTIKTDLVSGD